MTIAEKITRAKNDLDEVYDAGKKAQYDEFWDSMQNNGTRADYYYAFAGYAWTGKTFRPKYDFNRQGARYTDMFFYNLGMQGYSLIDILNECGVVLDTSGAYAVTGMFTFCYTTEIPHLDLSGVDDANKNIGSIFNSCRYLRKIAKLTLKENLLYTGSFTNCSALEEIEFAGVIGNTLDLRWSTLLNKPSITSLINTLSSTVTGMAVTLSVTAVNKAFETATGANDGSTSAEWTTLIAAKSNWTISLV